MALTDEELLLKEIVHALSHDPLLFFYNYLNPTLAKYSKKPIVVYLHQVDLLSRLQVKRPIRVLMGDEIGLGKTIEAAAILRYLEGRGEIKRILILTPKILVNQWIDELKRVGVSHLGISKIERDTIKIYSMGGFREGYYIASIDLVKREEHTKLIEDVDWDAIIVDEAHNAGYTTQRWKLIKKLVVERDENYEKHLILLSATPHRGNAVDYLYRLYLIDPYLIEEKIKNGEMDKKDFYSLTHGSILFRRTKDLVNKIEERKVFTACNFYALAIEPTWDERVFSHKLANFLKDKISTIYEDTPSPAALLAVLVRKRASSSPYAAIKTLSNILKGLSKKVPIEEVVLTNDDMKDAEDILGIDYGEIDEIETDIDDLVENLVRKCSNILDETDGRILRDLIEIAERIKFDDSKLKAITSIVDEYLHKGRKVIIFTEYRDTLEYLKMGFQRLSQKYGEGFFETISGKDKERFDEVKEKFEGENCKLLIATDVASEGLNLQVANIVINYDAPWSPIKLEQRVGRVWRLGQKRDVNIYTTFMGTDADLDIMRNLYGKLLAMKDALEDIKPILGKSVTIAYRSTAEASGQIWKTKNVQFAEIEVEGKREKINEFKLVLASLKGKLSQYIESLLDLLTRMDEEFSRKSVYPYTNPEEIKINLKDRISTDSSKEYKEYSRKLCKIIGKRFNFNFSQQEICRSNNFQKIWQLIEEETKKINKKIKQNAIFFSSSIKPNAKHCIFIAELKQDAHSVLEELIIYDKSQKRILYGIGALKYATRLFSKPLFSPSEINKRQFDLDTALGEEAYIKRKCQERYNNPIERSKEYMNKTLQMGFRKNEVKYSYHVDLRKLATVMGVKTEYISPSKEIRDIIDKAAMEFVIRKEKKEGRKPSDVHKKEHYDILSYDSSTGEERFIEVKGHAGWQIFAELTEEEYRFGKAKKDKYWVYIVFNLTIGGDVENAKLIKFQDAINTMNVKIKGGTLRYILAPRGL
jgi:superfamily II DNA or RNA helicase